MVKYMNLIRDMVIKTKIEQTGTLVAKWYIK